MRFSISAPYTSSHRQEYGEKFGAAAGLPLEHISKRHSARPWLPCSIMKLEMVHSAMMNQCLHSMIESRNSLIISLTMPYVISHVSGLYPFCIHAQCGKYLAHKRPSNALKADATRSWSCIGKNLKTPRYEPVPLCLNLQAIMHSSLD